MLRKELSMRPLEYLLIIPSVVTGFAGGDGSLERTFGGFHKSAYYSRLVCLKGVITEKFINGDNE